MAVITPQTDVYLLKVPLEIDNNNQLTFRNTQAQFNYFNSLPKIALDNFTYQRKDGVIRVGLPFDDLISYNYVMYRNEAYSDKWFYAFIDNMTYLNDNVTAVSIKTDVWQTYQFNLSYKPVFVEREHVNNDGYGLHTVPEGLEVGEYVRNDKAYEYFYTGGMYLAFQVTELISNMRDDSSGGRVYNGIYNGLIIVLVDDYNTADDLVSAYDDAGKHDAIISCFYVPKTLCPNPYVNSNVVLHGIPRTIYFPRQGNGETVMDSITLNMPTNLDGYTPKNNKMYTKEFCYLYVTNNTGTDVTYAFEDFRNTDSPIGEADGKAYFRIWGALSQGCSIKCFPAPMYKAGIGTYGTQYYTLGAYAEGINLGKMPICSWNSDYYTNWLTQNAVNIGVSAVSSIASAGMSIATGNVAGGVLGLFDGIAGTLAKNYEASLVPKQAKGNTNAGDINHSIRKGLSMFAMTVRREYAIRCDNYLSQFGYKVNELKVPNVTGRRNWNFVKTRGCYIEADIPQDDLSEIKGMFDKGVTFWHNPATFADYSQNNDII